MTNQDDIEPYIPAIPSDWADTPPSQSKEDIAVRLYDLVIKRSKEMYKGEIEELLQKWKQLTGKRVPGFMESKRIKLNMLYENEIIQGGLGDYKSDDEFDQDQLEKGIEVELEHTPDPRIAKEIAKDHLIEDPKYYTKLYKMEHPKG